MPRAKYGISIFAAVGVRGSYDAGGTAAPGVVYPARTPPLGPGYQVEPDELGRVLGVGEHDRPVVLVDHPAVVGGHVLLELPCPDPAGLLARGLGDLVVDEVHPADRVD